MPAFHAGYLGIADDGEFTRARPGLAPVRWLHARPRVFWNLPEPEFATARAERRRSHAQIGPIGDVIPVKEPGTFRGASLAHS
jgi:hypothetical protein